jgi:hypothetical protein
MSETTTAFLAGTAVAGVSALLLIKGGFSLGQPVTQMPVGMTPTQPQAVLSQVPAVAPITTTIPALTPEMLGQVGSDGLKSQFALQQQMIEQLKTQLEQQRVLATQLQTQLESQRTESQRVAAQIQDQKRDQDMRTLLQQSGVGVNVPVAQVQNQNNMQVIMLWAVGGVFLLLVVGGGVMLLTVVLMSQQSSSRRGGGKTNYIVQPLPMPAPPYNPPHYPQRPASPMYALPPRIRQVDAKAYYDDDDF